jgi:hypothetical protein
VEHIFNMGLCGGLGWWFGGLGIFSFLTCFFEKGGPSSGKKIQNALTV